MKKMLLFTALALVAISSPGCRWWSSMWDRSVVYDPSCGSPCISGTTSYDPMLPPIGADILPGPAEILPSP